jgi:hypothetical protein
LVALPELHEGGGIMKDDLMGALEDLTPVQLDRLGSLYLTCAESLSNPYLRTWNLSVSALVLSVLSQRQGAPGVDPAIDAEHLVSAALLPEKAHGKALAAAVMTAEGADDPTIRAFHGVLTDALNMARPAVSYN